MEEIYINSSDEKGNFIFSITSYGEVTKVREKPVKIELLINDSVDLYCGYLDQCTNYKALVGSGDYSPRTPYIVKYVGISKMKKKKDQRLIFQII